VARQAGIWLRLVLALLIVQLGYYNRRDLFAHWIRKDQPASRPCSHACCRGMRSHPEGYPVIKRNAYLRHSTDDELAAYYSRHQGDSQADEHARARVLHEMQRRDTAAERRERAEERRRERWASRRQFRASERERLYAAAETATTGYMLNRRGTEAGIDPRSLFTGPESRARKYASEELLNWWELNPRPTEAYFEGADARIGYGRRIGVRRRITSEEAVWRDAYDRAQYNIEHGLAA
jgi:hypothetical protein